MFLLNQNNRTKWSEWFDLSLDVGMKGSCIGTKKTYYDTLKTLEEWGFIRYEKGANEWRSPRISINPLSDIGLEIPKPEKVEVLNHTSASTSANHSASTSAILPLTIPQYPDKDYKTNTRQIQDNKTSEQFLEFWTAYPKKFSKPTAEKAFQKAIKKADLSKILESVKSQKDSDNWKRDGGQYIPNPATWLNGERWNDIIEIEKPKTYMEQLKEIDEQVKRNLDQIGHNQAKPSQVICDTPQIARSFDFDSGNR